ncbi:siderophore ABC transporter substrate-binding protein [Paenibacillus terrigena]|uniref:siderophore ABC transporter substrate-binding protein n=1 Tax=Paenibacillus terrigena TaxID=369333 RepID=UPI00037E0847|nr:siderophore ABC transporter substrate-binding protein [Paenibacillus terrigena]
MKKTFVFLFTIVLATALAACGTKNASEPASGNSTESQQSEEMTIKHQLGETVVKKNPSKVVVFDFGTLDTLDKLGVEVTAVPQTSIPSYLEKYKDTKYVNAGGLKEPDFEKISEVNPDLIIISARQADSYEEFKKLGPTIYMGVDTTKYMESFKENAKTLGQIFGKEAEVDKELASIDESIKALNEKVTANKKNSLIILANEGKISAYGPASRFGIIHDVFGYPAVDPSLDPKQTHGNSISYEYIAEKNPEVLFVVDRNKVAAKNSQSSAQEAIENDIVKKTTAYKDGKIIYLNPDYWYLSGGGLASVSEMVKEIEASV